MASHTYFCVDAHTCGNPVRVVAGGAPLLPHAPMAERRLEFVRHHDHVRRSLMFEPRGRRRDVEQHPLPAERPRVRHRHPPLSNSAAALMLRPRHDRHGDVAIEEGFVHIHPRARAAGPREGMARVVTMAYGQTVVSSTQFACSTSPATCTRGMRA